MLDLDPRDYDSRDEERHANTPSPEAGAAPATTIAITTRDNRALERATGTIVGSLTGMFVAAPLVVLLYGNAPIAGGLFGFGVLGIGVGVAVALLRRLFFGSVARRM
jgi:hypothetical protein